MTFPTKKTNSPWHFVNDAAAWPPFSARDSSKPSVPRRVSHLGSKDRRMVCKATGGFIVVVHLNGQLESKRGADIYTYIFIQMYRNVLTNAGKMGNTHIPKDLKIFFSFGVQPVCCTSGTEVLFRFRPCRWWKMRNQKTAFWRIFNGQRWKQRESSTWQLLKNSRPRALFWSPGWKLLYLLVNTDPG